MRSEMQTHAIQSLLVAGLLMMAHPTLAQTTVDASAAQSGVSAQVMVNGQAVQFQGQPPIEQNGHLLVPLRGVLEKLGAYVDFDSAHQSVVAFRGQTRITLPIGATQAQVNGQAVALDVPAQVVNGSTLVPLRFVAESLGAQVTFDVNTNTVRIAMPPVPPLASTPPSSGRALPPHNNDAARRARQAEDARRAAEARARAEAREKAAEAERQRLSTQNAVIGTVIAVYLDVSPPRIVLHIGGPGAPLENDRTIPLPGNVPVMFAHREGGTTPIPLNHVAEGDLVSVLQNGDGNGTAINVIAPPPGSPDFHTHPWIPGTFRGEFMAREEHEDMFRFRMVDGRVIDVPRNVPVVYKNHPVRPEDIRPGDVLSIVVDPKSHRGIRIIVNP